MKELNNSYLVYKHFEEKYKGFNIDEIREEELTEEKDFYLNTIDFAYEENKKEMFDYVFVVVDEYEGEVFSFVLNITTEDNKENELCEVLHEIQKKS